MSEGDVDAPTGYQCMVTTVLDEINRQCFTAVQSKNVDRLRQLFWSPDSHSINVNIVDENGYTCLGLAAEDGCLDIVKILVKNGASLNRLDYHGKTALHYACECGHLGVVQFLLESGADINFIEDRFAAVHYAASKGHADVMQLLIQCKCNVNILNKKGVSPLYCAVIGNHSEAVRLLLSAGANPNVRVNHRTPVFLAAEVGNIEIITELLHRGAKLNIVNQYGMTPLSVACNRNHSDIAAMFIQAGAKVNVADDRENLPLHYVARNGDIEVARMLIEAGSKLDVLNKYADSPLHFAIRMQHADMVRLLIFYGCFTDIYRDTERNIEGVTPLYSSISAYTDPVDFEEIVRLLIDGGCDLNLRVAEETVLYHALDLGKADLASVLLRHGADADVECPHDFTILNKACQRGMTSFIRLLVLNSWNWRYEHWLIAGYNTSGVTGFHRRNLGRFLDDTVDEDEVPMVLWHRMPLYYFLREMLSEPFTLQQFCRLTIRTHIMATGGRLYSRLDSLNYPFKLKSFLKFEDYI